MNKNKALKTLIGMIVSFALFVALFVWTFDPFYLYHEPFFGMQATLYDHDHQVAGSIRTLSYDRVFIGSSMVENFDPDYLDAKDGLTSIKAIKPSGRTADFIYYLNMIHDHQDVKEIYWGLDIYELITPPETTLYDNGVPRYLHTETILDDIPYLFNKDIIFKKIPTMIGYSLTGAYTGGKSYHWYEDKEFSASAAMRFYNKPATASAPLDVETEKRYVEQNTQLILQEVMAHPEIEYNLFYTPYSMLWWDNGYTGGLGEAYLYAMEASIPVLVECDNVNLYYFQTQRDIVLNLDNYMDLFHYHPWVNQYMLEAMETGTHLLTADNYQQYLSDLREMYQYIIEEGIYKYYEKTE